MYPALAVILLALAAFSVGSYRFAVRRERAAAVPPRESNAGPGSTRRGSYQQLQGFLYVGAAALAALAVAVLVIGMLGDRAGRAESLAMFGFFTYAVYLAGTLLLHRFVRRSTGRHRPPD